MPLETLDGVLLLGWMERDEALKYLCKECVFEQPVTEFEALAIWGEYRDKVQSLPERQPTMPARLPMNAAEAHAARTFRNRHRTQPAILDLVKVDPFHLAVHQLAIASGFSQTYVDKLSGKGWVEECLLKQRRSNVTQRLSPEGLHIELPHAEFMVAIHPGATFVVTEHAHYVSVAEFGGRMLLTAGYHRSFAYIRSAGNAPDAMARSIVAALTTDLPSQLAPANSALRAMLASPRAPLFGDFFDERLVMRVKLRKKRYEIFIHKQEHDILSDT